MSDVMIPRAGQYVWDDGTREAGEAAEPTFALLTLLGFLLVLILRPSDFVPALAQVPLALITFLAVLVAWLCSGRRTLLWPHATNKLVLALLAVMAFSVPFSYWPGGSFKGVILCAKLVCVFILMVNIITTLGAMVKVLWVMVAANAVHAALLLKAFLGGEMTRGRVFGAAGSIFGDPNDLALDFVVMLPITLWLVAHSRRALPRMAGLALGLLFLGGILATQSRGGWVALLAVVFLIVKNSRRRVLAAVAALGVGLAMIAALPPDIFDRWQSISDYHDDESVQSRFHTWAAGLRMWVDCPITGVGLGMFPTAYGTDYRTPDAPPPASLTAHNSLILVAAELGTPGLILWIGMLVAGFSALRDARCLLAPLAGACSEVDSMLRLCAALRAALVGYLICAMFLSRAYDWILMILLALAVSCWCTAWSMAGRQSAVEEAGQEWPSEEWPSAKPEMTFYEVPV